MYCCTGILFLCFLAATVKSFQDFLASDNGIRIVLNSSTVDKILENNAALYIGTGFYDASYVRSCLVNANFFKGFCEAQDLLTLHQRSHVLTSTRKLLLDGKNQLVRVPFKLKYPPPKSISFRISAWGAKHFMPCGVLLINFHTRTSYSNFLYNKSAFYEDLCHLESKCFPVGTYLPITSSATFELGFEGDYTYEQAMIVNEGVMVDGTVSEFINAESLLALVRVKRLIDLGLFDLKSVCKFAKQHLCNYGLAGRSAVFRYLPSLSNNMNDLFLCSAMINITSLRIYYYIALPGHGHSKMDVHPEIIVIEPLSYIGDHLVSISEGMRDPRIIYTLSKCIFPLIISLFIILFLFLFYIVNYCLKKQFNCFNLFAFLFIVLYVFLVFQYVFDCFLPLIFHNRARELKGKVTYCVFFFPYFCYFCHYLPLFTINSAGYFTTSPSSQVLSQGK